MTDLGGYPALSESKRQAARATARDNLMREMGGAPLFDEFLEATPSRYGARVDRFMIVTQVVLLMAAFIVSALHIYHVGKSTYRAGIDDPLQAIIAGLALVALSESAVLVLSVAPAVWPMPRSIKGLMYGGALLAAFIAAIGNIDVTITYTRAPFDWALAWGRSLGTQPAAFVMATMPPLLTLIVGQALKYRALEDMERRQASTRAFERATREWKAALSNLEQHPRWTHHYGTALWEAWTWRKKRSVLAAIDPTTRLALVRREMAAGDFFFQEISGNSSEKSGKTSGTQAQVIAYLRANPEEISSNLQKIAENCNVSITTAHRARRKVKNGARE